jgi:hypothetical protein
MLGRQLLPTSDFILNYHILQLRHQGETKEHGIKFSKAEVSII